MIRRLIRWLAREEIEAALSLGAKLERLGVDAEIAARCALARAEGELIGQRNTLDAVDAEVRGRFRIELEDVAAVRKRGVH